MFNSRKVSQERVMGISFVDILIQAVFLLLLILMVGYVDPVIQNNFEFHEAGKDLCNKINKDSPVSCVEFIKNKDVELTNAGEKNVDPAKDFCSKRKLSPKDCKSTLDQLADNGSLFPCMPPVSKSETTRTAYFIIRAPGEIEFNRFSDEYIKYLVGKGFSEKLRNTEAIVANGKKIYSPSEIISSFAFIKEESCFHEFSGDRPGKFSNSDLAKELNAVRSLRIIAK